MPTHEEPEPFLRDWDSLSSDQKTRFRSVVRRFAEDLDRGQGIRRGLRVRELATQPGIYELTWAEDGRALFRYGPSRIPGKRHVIWLRIGGHEILDRL